MSGSTAQQSVFQDHEVTEIYGWPTEIDLSGKTPILWVEAADGSGSYGADILHTTPVRRMARFAHVPYESEGSRLLEPSEGEFRKEVLDLLRKRDACLYRVDDTDDSLFAVVSQRWKRNDVENIVPIIESALPEYDYSIVEATGKHGGSAHVVLDQIEDILEPSIKINMGRKDGLHSMKVMNAGLMLWCTNQLTMEVANHLKPILPKAMSFFLKQRHCAKVLDEKWLTDTIVEAIDNAKWLVGAFDEAKEWVLDDGDARQLLTWYWHKGRMSQRTARGIYEAYLDEAISQEPETMYGMAMAMSWFGTHQKDVKPGVQGRMQIIAGEVTLMSPNTDTFFEDVIVPGVKDVEDNLFEGIIVEEEAE